MRVPAHGHQHSDPQIATDAKFPAPCLPVTWEESLQAMAGRTLENYKDYGMDENPYQSPKSGTGAIQGNHGDERKYRAGLQMAAFSIVLPFLVFLFVGFLISLVASSDPVPQGAMVLGVLVLLGSIVASATLFVVGVATAVTNRPH